MGVSEEIGDIKKNIGGEFIRRLSALYALCDFYHAKALDLFRKEQAENLFWTNRTGIARDMVFGGTKVTKKYASWGLAHGVEYGVYLEMANDRRFESLRPIIMFLEPEFVQDVRRLFGD